MSFEAMLGVYIAGSDYNDVKKFAEQIIQSFPPLLIEGREFKWQLHLLTHDVELELTPPA